MLLARWFTFLILYEVTFKRFVFVLMFVVLRDVRVAGTRKRAPALFLRGSSTFRVFPSVPSPPRPVYMVIRLRP